MQQETVEQEVIDRVDVGAMMVDENFDPSAAFLDSMRSEVVEEQLGANESLALEEGVEVQTEEGNEAIDSTINNDLQVSDSDDEEQRLQENQDPPEQGAGNIWF